MFLDDIKSLPKNQRIMGLDIGDSTIGIAISDILQTIATPRESYKRKKFTADAEHIFKICSAEQIGAIVIGLPLNMDGTEGAKCQSVRQFGRNLLKVQDIPIYFQDERMSTQAVTRTMRDAELSTIRKTQVVDKMAASFILQSALERVN